MALARLRLARFGSAGAKIDPLFLISHESDTLYHFFSLRVLLRLRLLHAALAAHVYDRGQRRHKQATAERETNG